MRPSSSLARLPWTTLRPPELALVEASDQDASTNTKTRSACSNARAALLCLLVRLHAARCHSTMKRGPLLVDEKTVYPHSALGCIDNAGIIDALSIKVAGTGYAGGIDQPITVETVKEFAA